MKDYRSIYEEWLLNPYFDEATKDELRGIGDDENEIKERFYQDLEFGTAGLRGIIGAGINRMNIYVVRKATQGLANYIINQGGADKGVAIAYDSRHMSPEFAEEAALTLAANGIKAYKFESLRPTPELSFAVRELGCIAGINITASHNPPEYNGYKVYWEDGAQFTPPHDKGVTAEVLNITDISTVKTTTVEAAKESGKYEIIGTDLDDKYIAHVKAQVVNQDAIDQMQNDIKIVYSPLHGTGNLPARRALKEIGFTHVYVVPEQELPDGDFPTVSYPNPEAEEAFLLGLALAKEKDADLVLATDPDADRLGVYVKDEKSGGYIPLTGNMSGSLLCEYVLSQKKERGAIPADGQVVKSIVTTNLVDAVAKAYSCELIEVLTGFKYIGQQILKEEATGYGTYMFGLEESYGCLIGTYARDKDAISATVALCEAAAYYKTK
ncbi:MAG: phospho-sugar mutase, partial [Lacrimispora sphenoides]